MKTTGLFQDYTPKELEKFEKDSEGVVVFNLFGENAVSFQNTKDSIIFYFDKVESKDDDDFPNLFQMEKSDVAKLYNFLTEYIKSHPECFKMTLEKPFHKA